MSGRGRSLVDTAGGRPLYSSWPTIRGRLPGAGRLLPALLVVAVACRAGPSEAPPENGARSIPTGPRATEGKTSSRDLKAALDRAERARRLIEEDPRQLEDRVRGLGDPDPLYRGACALALMRADAGAVLAALDAQPAEHATSERKLVEIEAVREMGGDVEDRWRRAVCELAERDRDDAIRSRAVVACLAVRGSTPERLRRFAGDRSWIVRTRLASWLARHAREVAGARGVLRRLRADPHATVRRAAGGGEPR